MAGGHNEGRVLAVPVALFYGAVFIVYGTHIPFTPVWLDWCGLSASEISTIMAAPFFLRVFVTPTVAMAADRGASHRGWLIALSWLSLGFVLVLTTARSFLPILLFAVPLMICNSTIMPLIETIAVQGMRLQGLDYGRMRLWGSLTFVAASFIGGVAVTHFGGGAGIWLVAIGSAVTVVAAHGLPSRATATSADDVNPANASFWHAREPRLLLAQREFRLFLVATGLVQAAHATFLVFGTLLWQKQGFSATWSGGLWAIGVFAEVTLFAVSGRVARRFGAAWLIAVGSASSILRWVIMAFEPPIYVLMPLQLLHGVTYGASQIGAIHFIHDAVPQHQLGSAQALYATVASGIAMGCATLIAGWVYARAGSTSYLAMAVIASVSLVAALRLIRIWDGGLLAKSPSA